MRYTSERYIRSNQSAGIAPIAIAAILVVIVVVAGVGIYYLSAGGSSSTTSSSTTSTQRSFDASSTTSVATSSAAAGMNTYTGTFNYTNPEGPGGERVLSNNNTVQSYNSTQVAAGSFTFSINETTYIGTGTGHGTMTVTTVGFCSGSVTFSYTFTVEVTHAPGENIIIGFSTPTPVNATVPLTCTGPMQGVDTATNNPVPFLSEYPGLISVPSIPATLSENMGYGTTYYYSLVQIS